MFAVRNGKWKLILGDGSGGRQNPKGKAFQKPYQLFDLDSDLAEQNNLIREYPEIESSMTKTFEEIAHGDQHRTKKKNNK